MLLKGILFDLDGVVTDTASYHFEAWLWLAKKYGLTLYHTMEIAMRGKSREASLAVLLEINAVKDKYDNKQKEKMCDEKNDYYKTLLHNLSKEDCLPGVLQFIETLHNEGIKVALVSSSLNALFILNKLEITDYFDVIVDPKSVNEGKPKPDIYLKGCEQLRLSPHFCLGIEDAPTGIQSIDSAGMFSIGIGNPEILKEATINFISTEELTLNKIKESIQIK